MWGHDLRSPGYHTYPGSRFGLIRLQEGRYIPSVNALSFAVVRNSWERTYSAYKYLLSGGNSEEDQQDAEEFIHPFIDFDDFVLNGLQRAASEQLHLLPQLFWISRPNGRITVDRIIRFESLQQGLNQVLTQAGRQGKPLIRKNASKPGDISKICSPDAQRKIGEIYRQEIDVFRFTPPISSPNLHLSPSPLHEVPSRI